ncbi:hypothetical protein V7122_06620, partial [Bacillus sp. JJ1532]
NKDDEGYLSDVSKYQFLIKRAIIEDRISEVEELLVPSHFLQSMKELYDVHKNYDDVINLADRILQNENFIDRHIKNEIRYYLCMSLARNKDDRFKEEIQLIDGAEHDFLFGFYYRQIGKTDKAIERYEAALAKRKPFARAQRDLVQVYLSVEDYDTAYKLAKENYEDDKKRNPFHIHAYFTSLLRGPSIPDKVNILRRLIDELRINKHENAREFFYRCKAQFEAIINNNERQAMLDINEAIEEFPKNHRVLIDKFHICAKFHNEKEMENIIKIYQERYNLKQIYNHNTVIKFNILLLAIRGEYDKIPSMARKLKSYPEEALDKLILKYTSPLEEFAAGKE